MYSRRNTLRLLGAGLITGTAGCSSFTFGGDPEYRPVVMENNHGTQHLMAVTITTVPEENGGFTEYFSDSWLVPPGDEHTFEEGIGVPDHTPEMLVLAVLDDETATTTEFTFDTRLTELRASITEAGQIEIHPNIRS